MRPIFISAHFLDAMGKGILNP